MKYLVKINELEKKIDYLKEQLDIILETITKLENEKKKLKWKGPASELFIKKYDDFIIKLKKLGMSSLECIRYFIQYYDKYGTKYEALKNKYVKAFVVEDEK